MFLNQLSFVKKNQLIFKSKNKTKTIINKLIVSNRIMSINKIIKTSKV